MGLIDIVMPEIKSNLRINSRSKDFNKIKEAAGVLNLAYLKLSSSEIGYAITNNPRKRIASKYMYLMNVYNKNIREHQVMFLLLNVFESAIRAKAAVLIADHFSNKPDNWWRDVATIDKNLVYPVSKAVQQLHREGMPIGTVNTFTLFDTLTLGELESIYNNYWSILRLLFLQKSYRSHILPTIGREDFADKIKYLRMARNDIAHHKPINYSRRSKNILIHDLELILRHLEFNFEGALNGIDPSSSITGHLTYI